MGKVDTYTKNRMEGLAWALRIIKSEENIEKGVKRLEQEVKFRGVTFAPLDIPAEAIHECNIILAKRLMNTLLLVFLKVFEEEFGWKKIRLQRMVELFSKHSAEFFDTDPLGERYVTMSDYATYFREQYDIGFSDDVVEELMSIENQNENKQLRRVQVGEIEKHLKNSYPEALEHLKKVLKL